MSKQNNLTDFLTDVANAIRAKKGSTDLINPQDFSSEIASLPSGLEIVDMTETTATIEPNKVYVWGMVERLNITLGASTDESDFFAFRFRCSKPTMTSLTVNGATWADDTELDATGKPILDLGSYYQCEIKGGTSALYARLMHYIHFADSNVESVLLANGVGDGLGVTYKDAADVTSISTWFKDNADITAFAELVNFSGITALVNNAFSNCSSLAEITLPASLTSIGTGAFKDCTTIAEISLPAGVTDIFSGAFSNCSSLTKVLNFENTQLISIENAVFRYCSSLAEIALPDTLKSIGTYAFQGAQFIEITFPAGLTSILNAAFYGCSSLTRVLNLEDTKVTSIRAQTFYACSALTEISLPAGLTSIENGVFYQCTSLAEISLPAGVTSIGNSVFLQCSSLQYIRIEATIPPALASTNAIPSTIGAIYVPDASVSAYQAATNWSTFASKIKGISEMPA